MKVLLDFLIGWNQGHAERREADAARYREREARFRREYDRRYRTDWRRS